MKKKKKNKQNVAIGTPYDDVFRTLLNDCRSLILPVLNEAFGEHYTGDERIEFSPNEHFMNRQDGEGDKRITDSNFKVIGEVEKEYLFECQSTPDSSMLVRLFEYETQAALDKGELIGSQLKVTIPHTAVLFLRSNAATPDRMEITIETPGGTVRYGIPVMKAVRYSLDEIFQKNLLFLIPFHIFSHESRLEEYNRDRAKLKELQAEYAEIVRRLDGLAEEGAISAYTRKVLLEMSNKVLKGIATKHKRVREGVRSVVGGRILKYEAKTIYHQGIRDGWKKGRLEGKREGKQEGKQEGSFQTLSELVQDGLLSPSEAARRAGMSEKAFLKKLS